MSFEVHVQTPPQPPYQQLRETWKELDRSGIDAIWTWDHFFTEFTPGDYEGWSLLAALAEATERCRIGVFVTAVTFRHPSLLAKIVNTVDHISEGRLVIGLGAARLPSEHETFGFEFPSGGKRLRLLEETCQVIEGLAGETPFSFDGEFARLKDASGYPLPIQRPRPPILIGGHGPRLLSLVARRADWWNGFGTPEAHARLNPKLDSECERNGRQPSSLKRLASVRESDVVPGISERYREAGADGVILIAGRNESSEVLDKVRVLSQPA